MAENNNSGSVGALLLLLGGSFIAWEIWKQKKCAATAAAAATTAPAANANAGATTNSNVGYPSSGTTAPSLINPGGIPIVQNPDTGFTLPPGISQTQYNIVQQWAYSENIPPTLALFAAGIPSEFATIVDLTTTVWTTTGVPTPQQAAAFTALTNKYDPQHKYY